MRILITRPREDAEPFARAVMALGHEAVIEPLLEIVYLPGADLELIGVQAILLTSANGARAVALRTKVREIAVLAVGPATAAGARDAGFSQVTVSSGEGVEALATFVSAKLRPADGTLIHATGSVTAGDLAGALGVRGFSVRREMIYEARAVDGFSGALVAELWSGMLDAVTFFSVRTAELFVAFSDHEDCDHACARLTAICLSPSVAAALAPIQFRAVKVAEKPSADAMLAAIGTT